MSFLASEIHPSGDTHSFDTPEKNVTVFYNRDRGESENDAKFATVEEWNKEHSSCIDYLYLFSAGRWFVKNVTDDLGWDLVANCLPEYSGSVTGEDYKFLLQALTY
jgi:type II secretory pathway component PulJ